ncbi:MAG: peptide-methionine (S)-S-oxide reductase, partial [Gemmatimonadetes bacterium]
MPPVPPDPPPVPPDPLGDGLEFATLGGGCFWCIEAVFEQVRGVHGVVSGYAGGTTPEPTYREVCGGRTGHAEVVQVRFDPRVLPYETLLEIFFSVHDPTTPDRQGPDVGTQYRSIILTHGEEQARVARETIGRLESEGVFGAPIVTQVVPFEDFWPAEDEHQGFFRRNPEQPY